ncbi:probable inactive purple acid phosphatase 1 [Neltuma alba]|uniref:probable inactive purple acid phosphatase 1 n=1 Tax=Neltuma alba TaxID=207710 RepID=UPI0010A41758|nr:probable inactive purple acid phosphatase 1 [Prosopis alba]
MADVVRWFKLMNMILLMLCFASLNHVDVLAHVHHVIGEQPLSKISIHKATFALDIRATIKANPSLLGLKGDDTEWVTVELNAPNPSEDDWVGVFSPANFNSATCPPENGEWIEAPFICTAPIKYKYANDSNPNYTTTGKLS